MTGPGVLYIIIWLYWSQIIVVTFSIRFYMNLDKNASEIMHAFVYNDEGTSEFCVAETVNAFKQGCIKFSIEKLERLNRNARLIVQHGKMYEKF